MKKHYSIKADSNLMKLLSAGIYRFKEFAVIRELSTNALDAVANTDGGVILEIKKIKNKYFFIVRDSGPGLTAEETVALMSTYGNSTKVGDEQVTGMFGIGSKSPFAYTDTFFIRANKNNKANYFKCFKDENGVPVIELIKTEDDNINHSGLEYRIPVKPEHLEIFIANAVWFVYSQVIGTPIVLKIELDNMNIAGGKLSNINSFICTVRPVAQLNKVTGAVVTKSISISDLVENLRTGVTFINSAYAYRFNYEMIGLIKKQPAYKLPQYETDPIAIRIGHADYSIKENAISVKPFFKKELILKFDPKEIQVTGSRESIEATSSNIAMIEKKIAEMNNAILDTVDPNITWATAFHRETEQFKMLEEITKDPMVHNMPSSNSRILVRHNGDKLFMKYIMKNSAGSLELSLHNIDKTFRIFDVLKNRTQIADSIDLHADKQVVICGFSRKQIDTDKLVLENRGSDIYFIDNDKDIKNILVFKKLVSYIRELEPFEDKIKIYLPEDREKFKRAKKKTANSKTAQPIGVKYYNFNADDINTIEQGDEDPAKGKIYVYQHRNDYILVNSITGNDYTTLANVGKNIDSIATYSLPSIMVLGHRDLQIEVFPNKKSFEKFINKENIKYNFKEVVATAIQKAVNGDNVLKHYLKLCSEDVFSSKIFNSRHSEISKLFKEYCSLEYDEYKFDIYRRSIDIYRNLHKDILNMVDYSKLDTELLTKMRNFISFIDAYYNTFTVYGGDNKHIAKAFNLFKAIHVDGTLSTEFDIFK